MDFTKKINYKKKIKEVSIVENIILIICLIFLLWDFMKNKKIFSPMVIFNLIWIITLGLYNLKFSYLQQDLSNRTLYLFLLNVIGFNITYIFISLFKINFKQKKERKKLKYSTEERLKFAKWFVIVLFIIEIIYSGGIPLIWNLTGSSKIYFDFGIPSVHGAFNGLVICLGAYSFFKKTNDKYLYLLIGVLIFSRQIMISMVVEAVIFNLFTSKKINWKKYIIIAVIGVIFFGVLGNLRSGKETMNKIFQPREQYENMPNSVKWVYSYMTFSISNFNNLVSITNGNVNHGSSMLNALVPTALLDIINVEVNYNPFYLISLNYNTNTSFPEIYLDFGAVGILIYGILLAFIGNSLYKKMNILKTEASILKYSVYVHNVVLLFFVNMFLYLPVIIQFIYIPLIFCSKESVSNE